MDAPVWPARNVAEYAYCPRLFYFMEVEGIHLPSEDTEEGNLVHRRVNEPSKSEVSKRAELGEGPRAIRSLTLTSQRLGLTATLDLAEVEGTTAVPIEYRKGRARRIRQSDGVDGQANDHDDVEPWPTDRIQVALQALLLEESGYQVPHCILYYAAEKRRLIVPWNEPLRSEALETLAAAKKCAQGPRPLPLLNDSRCPRCSLQPICLPDEVNAERVTAQGVESRLNPRKLWPPRDDGIHLVAQQNGTKVGVSGSAVVITDKNGRKIKELPLAGVESISLLGSVQISTQAIQTLSERSIPIALLTSAGRLTAMIDPLDSVSSQVRRAQVRRLDDAEACVQLSRALVSAKIQNQRTLLMRNHENLPRRASDDLNAELQSAQKATSIESLRGHEGQAAAIYFAHFAGMVTGELAAEFDANGRQRRPPPDPINAALSFAYSMLTHECTAALRTARLEPSIGEIRRYGRKFV